MKKIYLLLIMFSVTFGFAQNPGDTIVVQTFDYSMTYGQAWGPPRDTIAHFPNDPEKVPCLPCFHGFLMTRDSSKKNTRTQ